MIGIRNEETGKQRTGKTPSDEVYDSKAREVTQNLECLQLLYDLNSCRCSGRYASAFQAGVGDGDGGKSVAERRGANHNRLIHSEIH